MNCTEARENLPGLCYGDLASEQAAEVEKHLAGCPSCSVEYGTLQRLRRSLDLSRPPTVQVDLPRLYEQAAGHQVRRLRRWRRATLAIAATAAGLVLALALQVEIRAEAGQLVIRWGQVQPAAVPTPAPQPSSVTAEKPAITPDEIQLLKDLIHALAADVDARDEQQKAVLARLQARLLNAQAQADERYQAHERDMAALYVLSRKGE